ncbi:MAG: ATP-binding cassette domain-containing protein [Sulfuricurvum sp.]|uniref:ATP-binding cassette domain-containing protein n=1 Tax=Sulfuricurvum sp. TaxID=2025608 RepID=UPI002603F9E3|nr:ATP-binding cassette domain-containing protein [Sulfuricurvum sp.]MDD2829429.1 ATP-binding cassette domain-containing protein [Sulfuricurvum sp.]MDD4948209.1 ATP-binding cassette domain-containing protein [Sulfuricurvum sp.]
MKSIAIEHLKIVHKSKVLVECAFRIGSSLALVGQSGSGKSLILKTLLGLNESTLEIELRKSAHFEWIRGKSVSLVPQNPFTALSPLTKIKDQLFLSHEEAVRMFGWLGLAEELLNRYPSELSGGQLQRVIIGIALSSKPSLLLLDEPTTALDLNSKRALIDLLLSLQHQFGFSMLFVTHDMSVASQLCEDICVLKEGMIVEEGKMADVLRNPHHLYTQQLIDADFETREYRK